jgi:hypothetical protein
MKTAKVLASTFYYIVVAIIIITACSTKQLTTQMSRTSDCQTRETSIKSKQNESFLGHRIISMRDSSNHQYRIHIFPLDTFTFSIKDGFRGKASSIEVFGAERRVKQVSDRGAFTAKKESGVQYEHESKSRKTAVNNIKSVEKSKAGMIGIFIWIGLVGLIGWLGWRVWKVSLIRKFG